MNDSDIMSDDEIQRLFSDIEAPKLTSQPKGGKRTYGHVRTDPEDNENAEQRRAYQASVIRRLVRQGWFVGTTRLNIHSSDEHIAHIILRIHIHEITNYGPTFTGIEGYVYNDTWALMVTKVQEARMAISFEQLPMITTDTRRDDCMECEYVTNVHRWPKRRYKR